MKFLLSYNIDLYGDINLEATDQNAAETYGKSAIVVEAVKRELKEQIDDLVLDDGEFTLEIYEKENQNDKTQDSTSSNNSSTGDAGKDV